MRISLIAFLQLFCTIPALGAIQTKSIEYRVGDMVLEGYLAWDDAQDVQKPAVIVIHEWWGNNDYSKKRARDIAALGYVGFAIDLYGKGKTTNDPQQAGAWARAVREDPKKMETLLQAALNTLQAQTQVDPNRIAAIGYCFGGSMALNMARLGMDVDGVVSFHGDLSPLGVMQHRKITAKVLVCHGGNDSFIPQQQIDAFKQEMERAGVDFEMIVYPGAVHSFTNPDADRHGIAGVSYNAEADRKSWQDMTQFLRRIFD